MYFISFQGSFIQFTRLWMKTLMETDFERARLEKRMNRMEECRLDTSDSRLALVNMVLKLTKVEGIS